MKFNAYVATTACAWLLAILVIAAELLPPFKTLLASIFSHHWIGKSVLVAIAFIIAGFLWKGDSKTGVGSEKIAWWSSLASLAVIFLFYVIEFFT